MMILTFEDDEKELFQNMVNYVNDKMEIHNPQAVNRAIKRIYEAYNAEEIVKAKNEHRDPIIIPRFSCHHLRHTFCTRFCENETNVIAIMALFLPRRLTSDSYFFL